ncbi:MAG: flagellar biosynthesis protein FlhB [Clostridia bacterium]|nr:flagellar biosynthesis protein FlhB [Clostridia bacterium]
MQDYTRKIIPLNLQLFAGEKTEEATPRRRQQARSKGQVAKSQEFNSALVLLTGFAALSWFFPFMYSQIVAYTRLMLSTLSREDLTIGAIIALFQQMTVIGAKLLLPLLGTTLIAGMAANYLQVGMMFSTEAISVNLSRINPIEGLKRLFSTRSLVELGKSLFKVTLVGIVVYRIIRDNFDVFPKMLDMDLRASGAFLGGIIIKIGLQSAVLLMILAIIDFKYQQWEFNKSLKMSKEEIKEEYKQTEGNPQIKSKIREKMHRMSMRRIMQEIPKADVVITNPTHFAVALRYDGETMAAPKVVAKGQDNLALKIKEIAKEHGVVTVENKPLAQALYKGTEIGDSVPPELFQAVAEVLAFVYRLKGKIK